jgi:long-chain acyl-CoA synthetase
MINFCAAGGGAQTYFVSDPREIMAMLPRIRPHVFVGVPRFFEKFDAGVQQQLAEGPAWQRALVQRALAVGDAAARARRGGQAPGLATRAGAALADRLVLARLRQLLGGELRFLVSGSAPLPRWLAERFHAMGLLTLEAYGLSENIVPIAVNRRADFGFGTVGRVLPANEVRLAADGEVLVRGAGVFAGYLGGSADERRVDAEGFLHTGDLGAFDTNGRLCLLGRKSEVFKTSTGRKVVPAPIESRLKQLGAIDHAVVLGASRKVVTALVTPVAEQLPVLADDATWLNWAQALARRVRSEMGAQTGPGGGGLDRPGALLVLRGALSIEHGELTSNLKLRREPIARRHAPAIDALYERLERGGPFCEPIGPDLLIVSC